MLEIVHGLGQVGGHSVGAGADIAAAGGGG